jgi:glycosyltransferase involved in cell wall biosynthesis
MVAAALELRAALRVVVGASDIFSLYEDVQIPEQQPPPRLHDVSRDPRSQDVLVVHVAEVTPELNDFVLGRPERIVVIYHGTPDWEPYLLFEPECAGRYLATSLQFAALAERCDLAIASAPRNATVLIEAGFRNVVATPIRLDLDVLESVAPIEATSNHFRAGGPMVLYAGPIDPHNRIERLVEAFHVITTFHDATAMLVIAGSTAIPRYVRHVERQINELNLLGTWLAIEPEAELLATFYREAAAFVSPGVPSDLPSSMLSALQLGVPAIASDVPVVRDAVGDAATLVPTDMGPLELAEAILEVLPGGAAREAAIARGRERVAPFDAELAAAEWFSLILGAAG